VSWEYDDSEPLVTPLQISEYQRGRAGVPAEEWELPPTLVATFQRHAYARLVNQLDEASLDGDEDPAERLRVGALAQVPVVVTRLAIGAPAMAVELEPMIARGVRNVLVVGSAGSLQPHLPIGSTVVVASAEREDGTSHHYLPAEVEVEADAGLSDLLFTRASVHGLRPERGRAWTIDAPYRETTGAIRRHRAAGVLVVEMEAAAIFAIARVRGIRAGLVVAISDELFNVKYQPGFDDPRYRAALETNADAVMDTARALGPVS